MKFKKLFDKCLSFSTLRIIKFLRLGCSIFSSHFWTDSLHTNIGMRNVATWFWSQSCTFFDKCLCKILKVNKSLWEVATWFLFPQLHLLRQRPSFLRPRFLSFCALVKNIFPCGEFTKKNAEKGSRRNMKGECRKISERKWNGCKEFDLLYYTELNNKGCLKIRLIGTQRE